MLISIFQNFKITVQKGHAVLILLFASRGCLGKEEIDENNKNAHEEKIGVSNITQGKEEIDENNKNAHEEKIGVSNITQGSLSQARPLWSCLRHAGTFWVCVHELCGTCPLCAQASEC
jgi:hypothetical protein